MEKEEIWQAVLAQLELIFSKALFNTWLKNTKLNEFRDGRAVIGSSNGFTKEWLEKKFHKEIVKALREVVVEVKEIKYVVGFNTEEKQLQKQGIDSVKKTQPQKTKEEQEEWPETNERSLWIDKETNLNVRYTFDTFVVGANNELARAACVAVANNPGRAYNPIFIYGGVGLGKTHLLQSVGNEAIKRNPKTKVRYVSSEVFTNEMVEAIRKQSMDSFKQKYRAIDILIIDDIQFLSGKEKTQIEFFHTFNSLYSENKQIVLSSDRPPKSIPTLEERLRSRFEGGMIADVGHPDFETRMAILKKKIEEKEAEIPNEVVSYIAENIQQNVRELEGALNRVLVYCELGSIIPDVDITKKILASIISTPKTKATTPGAIIKLVADFYNLTEKDLTDRCRKKEIVNPRQIAMFLMREELSISFPGIGEHFGGRDHTTAMHAYEKIKRDVKISENLSQDIGLLKERLYIS